MRMRPRGRLAQALAPVQKRSTTIIFLAVVGVSIGLLLLGARHSVRVDVSGAYAACHAEGEDYTVLKSALSKRGVVFTSAGDRSSRVGYKRFFSTDWLCELSIDSEGRVASSHRLP
jgi:hypothetical protein